MSFIEVQGSTKFESSLLKLKRNFQPKAYPVGVIFDCDFDEDDCSIEFDDDDLENGAPQFTIDQKLTTESGYTFTDVSSICRLSLEA